MKDHNIKIIYYLRLFYCLFLVIYSFYPALAQKKVDFRNKHLKKDIVNIFENYSDVNGLQINFRNDVVESIYILGKIEDNILKGSKYKTYYSLKYSGDSLFLKKKFPLIDKFVRSDKLVDNIKGYEGERNFILTIEPLSTSIKPFSVPGSIFSGFRHSSLLEFTKRLNSHFKDGIIPSGDSILIIQAIVNKDGTLGKKMLLHGSEHDQLYRFLCENYEAYLNVDRADPQRHLFLPYRSGGRPFTSIIEIFVRLNPDKTFTVNGSGRERKLRIKDYEGGPNDPLQVF